MTEQSQAQTQSSNPKTTGVLALLTAKPGVTREQIMRFMPAEIRATVQLYLAGKIRECFSPEYQRHSRGPIHHGIFAARRRTPAGSRIHSGRTADAIRSSGRKSVSPSMTAPCHCYPSVTKESDNHRRQIWQRL